MTEITSSSRREAPSLDPEDFASWEMLFKNYCCYEEWKLFYADEPKVDEDELKHFALLKVTTPMNLAATREELDMT